MKNRIYLISEDDIKTFSNIADNVWGEYLSPAIWEAQEMGLQTILGECLYNDILEKVSEDDVPEHYSFIIDNYIQDYLLYKVISDLVPIIGVKLGNLGTVVSNDEHVQNLTSTERSNLQHHYQIKADFYARRLQEILLEDAELFGLDECTCKRLKSNLSSAASTGLFLGGARGRHLR